MAMAAPEPRALFQYLSAGIDKGQLHAEKGRRPALAYSAGSPIGQEQAFNFAWHRALCMMSSAHTFRVSVFCKLVVLIASCCQTPYLSKPCVATIH